MAEIVEQRPLRCPDSFERYRAFFSPVAPPSIELVRWLWTITPPGAPTVPIMESIGRDDGPGHVPLLRAFVRGDLREDIPAVPGPRQGQAVRAALPAGIGRAPGRQAPRSGRTRWAIECAYLRDLRGQSTIDIADRLELRDDQSRNGEGGSRSARRYVAAGRKTLAEIGAWPWALAAKGSLERDWCRSDTYALALFTWHRAAFCQAVNDALVAVDALGSEVTWRVGVERWDAGEALYLEWLDRAAAAQTARPA